MDRTRSMRYAVLGLLARAENGLHGWALMRQCEKRLGCIWPVKSGQIYRALDRLKNAGLVEQSHGSDCGPKRKVFLITERGKLQLSSFLSEPPPNDPYPLRAEFAVKFLLTEGDRLTARLRLVEREREIFVRRLDHVAGQRRVARARWANELATGLLIDGAEIHIRASISWLDRIALELRRRCANDGRSAVNS